MESILSKLWYQLGYLAASNRDWHSFIGQERNVLKRETRPRAVLPGVKPNVMVR